MMSFFTVCFFLYIGIRLLCANVMVSAFVSSFHVKLAIQQGVDAWSGSHPPTKTLPFNGDMTKGRLCHVPASFSDMGCG